jgi:hypothetical protein
MKAIMNETCGVGSIETNLPCPAFSKELSRENARMLLGRKRA